MRAQFIFSEIGIGLRRNVTLTIAVILTVTISLTLAGSGLLLKKQVEVMKGYWYDRIEVSVFLCGTISTAPNCAGKDVTQEQRDQLGRDLNATPQVAAVFYESKEDAYKRFREQFKDSPDLVDNVSPDALPESYRVKLKDPEQFAIVASAFQTQPGVDEVQDSRKVLAKVFEVLDVFKNIAYFVSGLMLVAALILISNTIRVAAFSRRRETGIMRLVGASNLYIQTPFLLEGAVAGLVGGLGACGLLALGKWYIVDEKLQPLVKFTNFIGWDAVFGLMPLVLVVAVAMSAGASFFTLRRHLRV